jgi:hypothetical protein
LIANKVVGDFVIPSVTINTVPQSFAGHNDIIQRNTIASWMKLRGTANILLLGSQAQLQADGRI